MEVFNRMFRLAKPYLQTRSNEIHTTVAKAFAEKLLEVEPGDPQLVIPAVLLHDVGWSALSEDQQVKAFGPHEYDRSLNRIHEEEGVKIARQILNQVGYDPVMSEEILQIIDGHDSRLTARSESDMIVKDADKLFRFSEQGIVFYLARFAMDRASLLSWLETKVNSWFFTPAAGVLAKEQLQKHSRFNHTG